MTHDLFGGPNRDLFDPREDPGSTRQHVTIRIYDAGDGPAGSIRLIPDPSRDPKTVRHYGLRLNKNHAPVMRFVTITHELGHLFLGQDKKLKIPKRPKLDSRQMEIEA